MKRIEGYDYDVVICGGGVVGCSLACLLAKANFKVALLDRDVRADRSSQKNDSRIFAITISSKRILNKTGAWHLIPEDSISPFRRMHVWDENGDGEIRFESASICEPAMGYIIAQNFLTDALFQKINEFENIDLIKGASPKSIEKEANAICIDIDNSQELKTKLVVAADGSNSKVRQLCNINFQKHDYEQSALACVVTTEIEHSAVARQRFLSDGPLAFLPMKNPHQSGIVWSAKPERIDELLKLDKATFQNELAVAFENKLGQIKESTERNIFPLSRAQADHYVQPRLALIGDSAHTVHPLAGLGANLGILDSASLAEILIDTYNSDRDIGRLQVLRRYERWRRTENQQIMYMLDGFKYLFENKFQSVQWLRNLGLDIVDEMPIVKNAIMARAMGLKGNLPRFARNYN